MPALPNVPQVLKVTYHFSDGVDLNAICRDYMKYSGGAPSNADCLTLATDVHASFVTNLVPQLGSVNQITGVQVTDLTSASAGTGEFLSSVTGTRSGLGMGGGTAVLVNKHIARRYRGGKPRTYWPFFTSSDILTPQTWKTASVSGLQTALAAHYAAVEALTVGTTVITNLSNVSYYQGFASVQNPVTLRWKNLSTPRTVPVVDVVTGFNVHQAPASQRRRNLT